MRDKVKVGDLVRVKKYDGRYKGGPHIWNEFMGKVGVIVDTAMRLHIPAFKVILDGAVQDFDHDELEPACPDLSDDQLDDVAGSLSPEEFDRWSVATLNKRSRE